MKPLKREEIFSKLRSVDKKKTYVVSWITDTVFVAEHKGKSLTVSVVAQAPVRFNLNYSNLKTVAERGELASRTKVVGGKKEVSRKREPWWKHDEKASSLCFHKSDEGLPEDSRRWYLQMFASTKTNRDSKTGRFAKGSTKVNPKLTYVFMLGTPDEEIIVDKKQIATIDKLRRKKDRPGEVWFKSCNLILAIDAKGGK